MSSYARGGASRNKATRLVDIDAAGVYLMTLNNRGAHNLVASFTKSDGTSILSDQDIKVSGEAVWDGDSLVSLPIHPGSVVLTSTGVPTLVDRDEDGIFHISGRDKEGHELLAHGTDGATSAPGTRTLTSATNNFTTSGVVAGDKVVLSSSADKGVYVVATVGTTTLVVTSNFPTGNLSAVTFSVYAEDHNCGTIDYFTGKVSLNYPSSPSAAAPSLKGTVLGTVSFPINLNPADTLIITVDGGAPATATFDAGRAEMNNNNNPVTGATLAASNSEVLSIKVDDETVAQPITFGAGTETTAALYAGVINAQLVGANAAADPNSLEAMIGTLNELRTDYTAHLADTNSHLIADAANPLTAPVCTNLATAITLATDLKTQYNLHRVEAGVHINNDATNTITTATPITLLAELVVLTAELKLDFNAHMIMASRLEESITLLNDQYIQYEAHRVMIGGGEHQNADATNIVTATAPATNLATALALAADLAAMYTAHLTMPTQEEEAVVLVNDLVLMYEAHRILTAGAVHGDVDALDDVTALSPATDAASAITLINDLATQFDAHILQVGGHTTGAFGGCAFVTRTTGAFGGCAFTIPAGTTVRLTDATNPFLAADVGRIITVANSTSPGNDGAFIITAWDGGVGAWVEYTNVAGVAEAFAAATVGYLPAEITDGTNPFVASDVGKTITIANSTTPANDGAFVITEIVGGGGGCYYTNVAAVAEAFAAATVGTVPDTHGAADVTYTLTVGYPVATIPNLVLLANDIRTQYEGHRQLIAGAVHGAADATNVTTAVAVNTAAVHATEDITHVVTATTPPTTVPELGLLSTDIKTQYELHRADAVSHTVADGTNIITAVDVDTAAVHGIDDIINTITSMPDSVAIWSDTYGTDSKIEIVSGTGTILAKLGLKAGSASGTGDADNIDAVTFAEAKAVIEADVADTLVTLDETGKIRISSDSAAVGALSIIEVGAASTAETKFGLDTTAHDGADAGAYVAVLAAYIQGVVVSSGTRKNYEVVGRVNDVVTVKVASKDGPGSAEVNIR